MLQGTFDLISIYCLVIIDRDLSNNQLVMLSPSFFDDLKFNNVTL